MQVQALFRLSLKMSISISRIHDHYLCWECNNPSILGSTSPLRNREVDCPLQCAVSLCHFSSWSNTFDACKLMIVMLMMMMFDYEHMYRVVLNAEMKGKKSKSWYKVWAVADLLVNLAVGCQYFPAVPLFSSHRHCCHLAITKLYYLVSWVQVWCCTDCDITSPRCIAAV